MSKLLDWIERHADWIIVLCIVTLIIFALSGCGFARGSLPEQPTDVAGDGFFDQLGSIGSQFIRYGLIVSGLALVAWIFTAKPLSDRIAVIGEIAGGCAIVGGAFVWISDHPVVVVLSCLATAVAYGYYRRAWLRRWLDRLTARAVKP